MDQRAEALARRLKQARTAAGLTQEEAARMFGVDQSTYQRWESATRGIDKFAGFVEGLFALAPRAGVSVSYLATGKQGAGEPDYADPIAGRRAAVAFARACGLDERAISEAEAADVRGDPGAASWYDRIRLRHDQLFGHAPPSLESPRERDR